MMGYRGDDSGMVININSISVMYSVIVLGLGCFAEGFALHLLLLLHCVMSINGAAGVSSRRSDRA